MKHNTLFIFLSGLFMATCLLLSNPACANPLEKDTSTYFNVTFGVGLGMYVKDMPTVPNEDIHNFKPAFSAKVYWQPPYRIQLGVETGYYPFYSTTAIQLDGEEPVDSKSNIQVLPIMLNVNMRVWKELRFAIGVGPALIFHETKSMGNTTSGIQLSAANFTLSASYLYPLTERIALGGELTHFYLGETVDNQLSLKLSLVYRFWKL